MKTKVMTTTRKAKPKFEVIDPKSVKALSLDEIEAKMMELATTDTDDVLTLMLNEKKLNMLEKIANLKMHRLQLKELEKQNVVVESKPLEIVFVKSDTEEQNKRIERIDNEILNKTTGNNNA